MTIGFTCIGGYLGSGKTTLLNRVLNREASANGPRTAVIVNDFGDVNIDAALVQDSTDGAGDTPTIALSNGCICCSLANGFVDALDAVRAHEPPIEQVLVEVSGVGDPWKTAQWGRSPGFELRGVIVLADLSRLAELIADPYVGDTIRNQLRVADLVVATKADLLDETTNEASERLAQLTESPVLVGPLDQNELDLITGGVEAGLLSTTADNPLLLDHPTHQVWSIDVQGFDREVLRNLLAEAPDSAVRAKAILVDAAGACVVQKVGRRIEVVPLRTPPQGPQPDEQPGPINSLVVIAAPSLTNGPEQANFAAWMEQFGPTPNHP